MPTHFGRPINAAALSSLRLTTTQLEEQLAERVNLVLIGQETKASVRPGSPPVLHRTVLLKGERSGLVFMHAHSQIALERLAAPMAAGVLAGKIHLGQLWTHLGIVASKVTLGRGNSSAGPLAGYFGVGPECPTFVHSYRVDCDGLPSMLIAETFPQVTSARTAPRSVSGS